MYDPSSVVVSLSTHTHTHTHTHTQIHIHFQISHIPHPSILNFVAAEIIQKNSQTFHHVISEYHERGTLHDYLQATAVDVHGLLVLAESIASGLAHLHSELSDNQGVLVKSAIAHCNLTSRSIYVKSDGKPTFTLFFLEKRLAGLYFYGRRETGYKAI